MMQKALAKSHIEEIMKTSQVLSTHQNLYAKGTVSKIHLFDVLFNWTKIKTAVMSDG